MEIDNIEDLNLTEKYTIIDVTLRDGGHVRKFNWPIRYTQVIIELYPKYKTQIY